MKKIYIYLSLILASISFNSYGQLDCTTAITPAVGENTAFPNYDYQYWYTYTAGSNPELVVISGDPNAWGWVSMEVYGDCSFSNNLAYGDNWNDIALVLSPNQTIKFALYDYDYYGPYNWNFAVSVGNTNANYYWVGNEGDWSDYANHWATTSGGSTFHTQPPNFSDNVFFDANSFSEESKVTVDTLALCYNMDWSGALSGTEFYASSSNRVKIFGSLTMEDSVYRDVYYFDFGSYDNSVKTIDMANNTVRKNSSVSWDGYLTFESSGTWELIDSLHASDIRLQGQLTTNSFPVDLTNSLYIYNTQ